MAVQELDSSQMQQAVGKYVVNYKSDIGKYVVKVESVDMDNETMVYEVQTGPNKGTKKEGKFVNNRPLKVYDEDSAVEAMMEV